MSVATVIHTGTVSGSPLSCASGLQCPWGVAAWGLKLGYYMTIRDVLYLALSSVHTFFASISSSGIACYYHAPKYLSHKLTL
jgi:hypothetical protein